MAAYRNLFLPPVDRSMKILDRTFFRKAIPLTAADVGELRNIARVKRECAKDILEVPRIKNSMTTIQHRDENRKVILLKPEINPKSDPAKYSKQLRYFLDEKWLRLIPYTLNLDYDYWTYEEILRAILPESLGAPPHSYHPVGHIGNLRLKPEFHPYKSIIAQVLLDKTPQLKTIVIKPLPGPTDDPDVPLPPLEHLAGQENTNVRVRDSGCDLKFDYALTDYDPRIHHSTKILVSEIIGKRKAIADVSAGLSTLAVQAARNKTLVYVNNPNPHNHTTLLSNIPRSLPIPDFIRTFNLPAREFVRTAITTLRSRSEDDRTKSVPLPLPHNNKLKPRPAPMMMRLPATFQHFIVPHTVGGLSFLDAFRGAYADQEVNHYMMPTIHVYTYHVHKHPQFAKPDIVAGIRKYLDYGIDENDVELEAALEGKGATLFRVSFPLPRDVAIGKNTNQKDFAAEIARQHQAGQRKKRTLKKVKKMDKEEVENNADEKIDERGGDAQITKAS